VQPPGVFVVAIARRPPLYCTEIAAGSFEQTRTIESRGQAGSGVVLLLTFSREDGLELFFLGSTLSSHWSRALSGWGGSAGSVSIGCAGVMHQA